MTSAGRHWHFEEPDNSCFGWRVVIELEGVDNTAEIELGCPDSVGGAVGGTAGLRISDVSRSLLKE